jgi:hypothetical protein
MKLKDFIGNQITLLTRNILYFNISFTSLGFIFNSFKIIFGEFNLFWCLSIITQSMSKIIALILFIILIIVKLLLDLCNILFRII